MDTPFFVQTDQHTHIGDHSSSLHLLAQAANVLPSKGKIQASPSITSIPTQTEGATSDSGVLKAILSLSTKFDDKFRALQSELTHELTDLKLEVLKLTQSNTEADLAEVKLMVAKLVEAQEERAVGMDNVEVCMVDVQNRLTTIEEHMSSVHAMDDKLTKFMTCVNLGGKKSDEKEEVVVEEEIKEDVAHVEEVAQTEGELKRKYSESEAAGEDNMKLFKRQRSKDKTNAFDQYKSKSFTPTLLLTDKFDDEQLVDYGDSDQEPEYPDVAERVRASLEAELIKSKSEQLYLEAKSDFAQTEEAQTQTKVVLQSDLAQTQTEQVEQTATEKSKAVTSLQIQPAVIVQDAPKESKAEYEGKGKGILIEVPKSEKKEREKLEFIAALTQKETMKELENAAKTAGMKLNDYIELVKREEGRLKQLATGSSTQVQHSKKEIVEEVDPTMQAVDEQIESDQLLSLRIQEEEDRLQKITLFFKQQAWDSKIIDYQCMVEKDDIVLICTLQNRTKKTLKFKDLYKVGFEEWKYIARWSSRITDDQARNKIKQETVYMVNTAFMLGYISQEKYQQFCVANNITLKTRSLGLDNSEGGKNEHPVPEGIVFIERTYVKTDSHEGLCYINPNGEPCFQELSGIYRCSLIHCLGLLSECKEIQASPFRKKLINWLFDNLFQIKKIGGMKARVERIIEEFQQFYDQSEAQMRQQIQWKKDRFEEKQTRHEQYKKAKQELRAKEEKKKKRKKRKY